MRENWGGLPDQKPGLSKRKHFPLRVLQSVKPDLDHTREESKDEPECSRVSELVK